MPNTKKNVKIESLLKIKIQPKFQVYLEFYFEFCIQKIYNLNK